MGAISHFFTSLKLQLGPRAWHNFRIDAGASVLFSFFNVVFNQFYIPMAIQEGASNIQVGLLSAAPAIGLLFSPIWAGWIERSNPKPYMMIPNLIGRALIILPAFFGVPIVYVVVALLFQMLMGIQAPAYASLIIRMYPPEHRGKLMANVRVAMGVLMIPLAFFIGSWTDAAGPKGPLLVAAVTGVISILIFTRIRAKKEAPLKSLTGKRSSLREQLQLIKQNREMAMFFLACTFTGFGNILAQPLYQIIQVTHLQLTNTEIGYARVTYFTCLLVAYFVVGGVIDRLSAKHTVAFGLAAFSIVPLLYAIFGNYPGVLIGSGVQGIGDAVWDIGFLAYVFRLAPGREAVVFGLHLMLFGIRGTIGPLLSTYMSGVVPVADLLYGASFFGWIGLLSFVVYAWKTKTKPATL
ncbi:nitrate transporter [Paenibacillus baekrokdamisoli]|uniref:Nitrate transporter n=1 Tax=Paenibacillus baekrokdamisoli TaxID=1712516 RepID=A0A3G9JEE1_9BACL|nr:MFS transporter [Paenibacillus baekrokdamisoli]MBB3071145.1 MFS family permease [Paenibacillus baekrokdamisoli]BBH21564.1 nitrate transporter [Paenibacillus baekrokdamisoli]